MNAMANLKRPLRPVNPDSDPDFRNSPAVKREEDTELESDEVQALDEMIEAGRYSTETVFELPAGYMDSEGNVHRDFTLREMTGKDEEAIAQANVSTNGAKVIAALLSRCVMRVGSYTQKEMGQIKWREFIQGLYVGDQDYMFLMLRAVSLGQDFEVMNTCPNKQCNAKLKTTVSVDEVEVVPFSGDRKIKFELPRGYVDKKGKMHKKGYITLPTGLDRELLTPMARSNLARANTKMLVRLTHFDDGAYIDEEILSNWTSKDRSYLMNLLEDHQFGPKSEITVTCDQCGEIFIGALNSSNFT
jgi:hypothetical protein